MYLSGYLFKPFSVLTYLLKYGHSSFTDPKFVLAILTQEQAWDLFSAIQDFKCLLDELADYNKRDDPVGIHLFKEDEVGKLR